MSTSGVSAEVEILDVLARYARGLDIRDFAMVAACFAPDATAEYSGRQFAGADAIVAFVHAVERFRATTHVITNAVVEVDGDRATAHSQAVAYMVSSEAEPDIVRIRGIRYDDELARIGGKWRITKRLHRADWSTTVRSDAVQVPPST
jgi:ketosteroid isomerase-like protein